jgi:hypothetical protein
MKPEITFVLGLAMSAAAVTDASAQAAASRTTLTVTEAGAVCNGATDDAAAFNRALEMAGRAGGGIVNVPARGRCVIGSTITIPGNVTLMGDGRTSSALLAGARNLDPMIRIGGQSAAIMNLQVDSGHAGRNTSGAAVAMGNYGWVTVSGLNIDGPCIGIDINGNTIYIDGNNIDGVQGANCYGMRVGNLTTGGNTTDARITRTTVGGDHATPAGAALLVVDSGGLFMSNSDLLYAEAGTRIKPGAGQVVQWASFSNTVVGDSNARYGLEIDTGASSAVVKGLQCNGCWAASAAIANIVVKNTGGGKVTGLHFTGLRNYNSGGDGVIVESGVSDITFDASHFCGGATGAADLRFAAGVRSIGIRDNRIGGGCDSYGTRPAFGIVLSGSNRNAVIAGNDFTGVRTIMEGSPTGNSVVANNTVLDNQTETVASAPTIAIHNYSTVFVTGTATVSTITGGLWNGRTVNLIPIGGAVTFATGGNICNRFTSVLKQPVTAWYSGKCWYLK